MTTAPSIHLPEVSEFRAPEHWRAIDVLSDLHLRADTPQTCNALFAHLNNTDADAVFILGDMAEVWVGDDCRFDGFEAELHARLRQAAERRCLAFMGGNRDFLIGSDMLNSAGMLALPDPTALRAFGLQVLLTHGDALCLSDTAYQHFRAQIRAPHWLARFLALPLAERRERARHMRDASEQRRQQGHHSHAEHLSESEYSIDIDTPAALQWLQAASCTTLLHGHTHKPSCDALDNQHARWVTSDWDFDHGNTRGDVIRLSSAGLQRIPPSL